MNLHSPVNDMYQVAFIGNYVPRRCGIATFTADLCESVAQVSGPNIQSFAVPMNDVPEGYPYPERVRFEVRQHVRGDYLMAADYFNLNQVDVICVQHEFGIFGGTYGSFILDLLKRLRMPIVTTLHTILKEPTGSQRLVIQELGKISDRLVTMSLLGREFLEEIYKIPPEKIVYIPHGIPNVPFIDPSYYKDQFGVEGRKVILTFGLLSPGKGIEYMIEALPRIVETHPEVVYVVLGATHPHVRKHSGEEYRQSLQLRVQQLGLQEHVLFHNRYVELKELCEYLGTADIYVTPYLNPAQIVSGTLSYALGAGKAVVSTPYWHAEEMLAEERGRLVPFQDSQALAEQINDLLDHEIERNAMRKRAYQYTRRMVWEEVAMDYLRVFQEIKSERIVSPRPLFRLARELSPSDRLPEIDLRHLRTLTDDTGMIQHAIMCTPDRHHGYTTDDNARALIAAVRYWRLRQDPTVFDLIQTYLSFLLYAYNDQTHRYRNFMRYDRVWLEEIGSQDSHGRSVWAMGETTAYAPNQAILALATRTFKLSLQVVEEFEHPRAQAFCLLGIHSYLRRFGGDTDARRCREMLANKLLDLFRQHSSEDWIFCDDLLSYDNARPAQALLMSGQWLGNQEMIDYGLRCLQWLLDLQTNENGHISIIGNKGWLIRGGGEKARFDQQPVDANALVEACIEAFKVTQDKKWLQEAHRCFQWYTGYNDLKLPLIDFSTGGCRDSLTPDGVNLNQGAESTLSLLLSVLAMFEHEKEMVLQDLEQEREQKVKPLIPVA